MGHGRITLAGVQFSGQPRQKPRNTETAVRLIEQAAARGAQIIVTPEAAINGYGGTTRDCAAEPIPGPTTERFGELAKSLGVYLLIGLYEEIEGQYCNAVAVIEPSGELAWVMRKVHLNRFETPGGWRNGSDFPVWRFDTATGSMTAGIMICYDRELPESARLLMLKGADVIFNPLACRCPKDEIHRCLLRTRAFENELYVFMVNHAEPHQNGHSFAVDYDGTIRAELDDQEGILLYEVDLDALEMRRANGIYGKHHRRPELYGPLADLAGQIHPENANLPPRARVRSL